MNKAYYTVNLEPGTTLLEYVNSALFEYFYTNKPIGLFTTSLTKVFIMLLLSPSHDMTEGDRDIFLLLSISRVCLK